MRMLRSLALLALWSVSAFAQIELGPGAGISYVGAIGSTALPVDSVTFTPPGSQSLPGTSATFTISPLPQDSGHREVKLYWKPNTAADSAYALIGAAAYNATNGWYDIVWTFPSCAVFPAGPPDEQLATLKATAKGGDGVTRQAVNDSYALTGRGC